jgi:hypothetical protein
MLDGLGMPACASSILPCTAQRFGSKVGGLTSNQVVAMKRPTYARKLCRPGGNSLYRETLRGPDCQATGRPIGLATTWATRIRPLTAMTFCGHVCRLSTPRKLQAQKPWR